MAKAKQEIATADQSKNLAAADPYADYKGPRGTDTIDSEDVTMPRLKLAQAMSKVTQDGACKAGEFIHNITNTILIPLGERSSIVPICYSKQYILWRDINDGGGIFARANPVYVEVDGQKVRRYLWDRPNEEFTHKLGGKQKVTWKTGQYVDDNDIAKWGSEIPGNRESGIAATAHHNYVVMLWDLPGLPMLAMSLSRTSAKKARDLNAMLKQGNAPIFARKYSTASVIEKSDANEYFNWVFAPNGYVMPDDPMFRSLADLHETLRVRGINVDYSDNEGDQGANTEGEGKKF